MKYELCLSSSSESCMVRLLHCQVEHHVRDKFATPILYGIDNFKFYDKISTYT